MGNLRNRQTERALPALSDVQIVRGKYGDRGLGTREERRTGRPNREETGWATKDSRGGGGGGAGWGGITLDCGT